jgi:hypothetical protein
MGMSMSMPQVCLLTKEQVAQFWPEIEPRLDSTPLLLDFFTKEDIMTAVFKNEMQVWTAGNDLILITQVLTRSIRVLQIVWAHGNGIQEHWTELKDKFNTFGWMTGCKKIEVLGRQGWTRRFRKELGFEIKYVAMQADIQRPYLH